MKCDRCGCCTARFAFTECVRCGGFGDVTYDVDAAYVTTDFCPVCHGDGDLSWLRCDCDEQGEHTERALP